MSDTIDKMCLPGEESHDNLARFVKDTRGLSASMHGAWPDDTGLAAAAWAGAFNKELEMP
jgi:hypothetical protein